ncbi:hypothetical protein GE21DRAFT_1211959 [Neurospora crassa]|nr:hypothetical protein GE21DRAFT_1211959 [Neurospora crassa]
MLDIDAGTITTYRKPGASVTIRVTVSAGANDAVTNPSSSPVPYSSSSSSST